MASPGTMPPLNDQVREAAADWLVAFCEAEVDPSRSEQFVSWLQASPEHVRAYLRLSALWEDDDLFSSRRLDADALVQRALAESNVIDLAEPRGVDRERTFAPARRKSRQAPRLLGMSRSHVAIAAALVLVVSNALFFWLRADVRFTYETAVGERRAVTLADGSSIELNARSKVSVRYDEERRSIELMEGQALFRVAKDAARPFVVRTGITDIRAVGTQFDVYRKLDATVVSVLEGRVSVSRPNGFGQAADGGSTNAFVTAGEQVIATSRVISRPLRADVAAATAWLRGELVFDATPLREVIEEFNRHTPRQLLLDDPSLGEVPISGNFASADSAALVEFLRQRFGVVVHESDREIHIARR